jgi:hypothetical protein
MSDAVVRAVLTSDLGTVQYVDQVQSSYSEHSGEWLPETCVYKRFIDGKENMHEEIHVTVMSINQPLPPETFELSGIPELRAGTSVNWVSSDHAPPGRPGTLVWDGSRIVPRGGVAGTIPDEEGSAGMFGSRRILLAVNVLVVSVLVAIVVWLRRKRRQA